MFAEVFVMEGSNTMQSPQQRTPAAKAIAKRVRFFKRTPCQPCAFAGPW